MIRYSESRVYDNLLKTELKRKAWIHSTVLRVSLFFSLCVCPRAVNDKNWNTFCSTVNGLYNICLLFASKQEKNGIKKVYTTCVHVHVHAQHLESVTENNLPSTPKTNQRQKKLDRKNWRKTFPNQKMKLKLNFIWNLINHRMTYAVLDISLHYLDFKECIGCARLCVCMCIWVFADNIQNLLSY